MSLLEITDLRIAYGDRPAVEGVALTVAPGEIVALVGESGSGKSTTAHAVIGLLPGSAAVTGSVRFAGEELVGLRDKELEAVRGRRIGFVPQDPGVSLNPVKRIGEQIAETLRAHGLADRKGAAEEALKVLERAGLPDPELRARQYPHQLSGGMKQRVLIGIALSCGPELIIADEPTSALDVTVQRRILDHLEERARTTGTAVLLITHDLAVAADRADRVVVLRHGRVVEQGPASAVLTEPREDYTKALIAAAPTLTSDRLKTTDPAGVPVLRVEGLRKDFGSTLAVDDVSFAVRAGETYGLIGESGSGKSTIARLVLRLEDPTAGRITVVDEDVTALRGKALRGFRRRVQLVYQNPYSSLDPRFTVEQAVAQPAKAFAVGDTASRRRSVAELLDRVALSADTIDRRAGELSGGQRQRVAIARALILEPEIVVLDEPVSALDVSVQDQILRLLVDLQAERGLAYLFISHDFAVVRQVADTVGVLQAGRLVEQGPAEEVLREPEHPFTRELLAAVPGREVRV
ncbi:ABC transporter ATP-binding protein [Pseudonocardia ailaonensis]|uniref:ABC transporter ATP-binding protein n=1 Tax=Pseudonocardia ailaonensis TaxID=367279 RepID=A0ABN2N4R5_9PSEU